MKAKVLTAAVAAAFSSIICGQAAAALIVTISDAGNGQTAFTFSGEAQLTSADIKLYRLDADLGDGSWRRFGDFLDDSTRINSIFAAMETTATVSVNGGDDIRDIEGIYLSNRNSGADSFGIQVSSNLGIEAGDMVSWTGSLNVALNYSSFLEGRFLGDIIMNLEEDQENDEESEPDPARLSIQFAVGEPAVVPVPAAAPLFIAGLAGLGFARRRRKVLPQS